MQDEPNDNIYLSNTTPIKHGQPRPDDLGESALPMAEQLKIAHGFFIPQMQSKNKFYNIYGFKFLFLLQRVTEKKVIIATILHGPNKKCFVIVGGFPKFKQCKDYDWAMRNYEVKFTSEKYKAFHDWDLNVLTPYEEILWAYDFKLSGNETLYKKYLLNKHNNSIDAT